MKAKGAAMTKPEASEQEPLRALGPCGKHPRKIAETPSQAWYRAYESESADKDPAQHCPECDRLAVARKIAEARVQALKEARDVCDEFRKTEYGPHGTEFVASEDVDRVRRQIEELIGAALEAIVKTTWSEPRS